MAQDRFAALLTPDAEDSKYLIRSPLDVLFILREISKQKALVTLHFAHGNDFILTSILDIDAGRGEMVLDYGSNHKLCQQALGEHKLACTTAHDQAKVQFAVEGVRKVRFDRRDAFATRLPDALLRLQRREDFRVAAPVATPLKCVIPLPAGAPATHAEIMLLDISCSGIALIDHHPGIALEPGRTYSGCRLDLPDIGAITFALRVKDACAFRLRNGLACRRAGCEFVAMPQGTVALVRRYILKLERTKNARLKGLV